MTYKVYEWLQTEVGRKAIKGSREVTINLDGWSSRLSYLY